MAIASSLLSIGPRVRKKHGRLVASTAWLVCVATLGLLYRRVTVDPKRQEIYLHRRCCWFFARTKRIPFTAVAAILYGYQDLAYSGIFSWSHDSVDLFSVGLRLQSGRRRHLFYFYGDGTFTNDGPLPDWMYWENYLFDLSGTQERESRAFVEVLSKMIGAEIAPP